MGTLNKAVFTSDHYYRFNVRVTYADTVTISGSSTSLSNLFSAQFLVSESSPATTPSGYMNFHQGRVRLPIKVTTSIGNTSLGTWYFRRTSQNYPFLSDTVTSGHHDLVTTDTIATSSIFNSSNKTSRTATLTYPLYTTAYLAMSRETCADDPPTAGESGGSGHYGNQSVATILTTDTWGSGGVNIGTTTVTLNAPPTFTASQVSYNTNYVYAGYTTGSVTVSNATAYYGGDITSITLTIGGQTVSRTTSGTLSIPLGAAGVFTPIVTVTDSRGQATTQNLNPITVLARQNPSCIIKADRVVATSGKYVINDEGTNAVITMSNITWTSAVATLDSPTVTVTDRNQQTSSPTVTWYANWAADGTLSNQITNWTTYTGTTAYGLVTNSFDVRYGYTFKVTPRDKDVQGTNHSGTVAAFQLPSAYYTIDFLAGGHGIAFGAFATKEGFYCEMDAMFGNEVYLDVDTNAGSGTTDHDLYTAIYNLGWWNDVNVNV